MIIGVDDGHTLSGIDYGAVGLKTETSFTREVGNRVQALLKQKGHTVVNCTVDSATTVNNSLAERVRLANAQPLDLFVSIHANISADTNAHGTEVFISARGGQAEKYANSVIDSICSLGYYKRGVRVAKEYLGYNLYVLSNTTAPAILIEGLFVSSTEDLKLYNADAMAEKIVEGILGQAQSAQPAQKPQQWGQVVNVSTKLNVRSSEGGEVIGCLFPNEKMVINYESGDWYNVTYNANGGLLNKTGFASKQYITKI